MRILRNQINEIERANAEYPQIHYLYLKKRDLNNYCSETSRGKQLGLSLFIFLKTLKGTHPFLKLLPKISSELSVTCIMYTSCQ